MKEEYVTIWSTNCNCSKLRPEANNLTVFPNALIKFPNAFSSFAILLRIDVKLSTKAEVIVKFSLSI